MPQPPSSWLVLSSCAHRAARAIRSGSLVTQGSHASRANGIGVGNALVTAAKSTHRMGRGFGAGDMLGHQTRGMSGKVESSTFEVFQALYEREYLERMKVAKLMNSMADIAEKKKQVRAEQTTRKEEMFKVKGIFALGMQLPDVITHDVVVDMLKRMVYQSERLHLDSLLRIIDLATPILAKEPNIQIIEQEERVIVIGDLHGSIQDLMLCFENGSYPSKDVHIVFNGDFVDRGENSAEVLGTILAFKIMYPDTVHLNRGNHEDTNVGRAYGFFDEIMTKYGSRAVYDRIGELFSSIPLCCVIRNKAFIVHAGIPSLPGATILHIGAIGRRGMKATVASQWDEKDLSGKRKQRPSGMRLLEDLLWSDPVSPEEGAILDDYSEPNMMRGAGIIYGPKMIRDWLRGIDCRYMVRSHQCVESGSIILECGEDYACYTVFSASNYQGGRNEAALLIFEPGPGRPTVVKHRVSNPGPELAEKNMQALLSLIGANKKRLRSGFTAAADGGKRQYISLKEWSDVLRKQLDMDLNFEKLREDLLDATCLHPGEGGGVDWSAFLDRYRVSIELRGQSQDVKCGVGAGDKLQALMSQRLMLGAVFRMIDVNGDGMLSRREVAMGVETLNGHLPDEDKIDADELFAMMDRNGTGYLSVDEFTEVWNVTPR